ncbi:MAG TPA: TRAP transporter substrate-binding protein [Syntrophales bacterium]|nr:TRAP transporter substrate-binding protein [Syntrophales bacterium]HPQ44504.1 TRAP transporter substrate-binding protein [Syntrophales bacterium]
MVNESRGKWSLKAVIVVSVFALLLTGFVGSASAKVYKFTLQNMFSMNHPVSIALDKMSKDLKAATDGQIVIQSIPPGGLVKSPEIFESVGNGAIDMGTTCSCYHAGILPMAATAFALPGDPRGPMNILSFIYDEGILEFFREAYAKHNVVYGAPVCWAGYTLVSKKPIQSWDDLRKLKVRATGSTAKNLKKLDVPTVFIPFAEIYVGLARGTIDAEISGSHTESFLAKTYEVAKYQMTPDVSGAQNCEIIINKTRWDALPANLRAIFEIALKQYAFDVTRMFETEDRLSKAKMEAAGAQYLELPAEVVKKWQDSAMELWDELAAQDELCAEYIKRSKEHIKSLGF